MILIGNESFENRCYKVVNGGKDWNQAENDCVSMGGHLVSIHSIAEVNFLQSIIGKPKYGLRSGYSGWIWIGAKRATQSGPSNVKFQWSDGSNFDYEYWDAGEPNDYGGQEDCAHHYGKAGDGKWNDRQCSLRFSYICKK